MELRPSQVRVEPRVLRDGDQHVQVADVPALFEEGAQDGLLHRALPGSFGNRDQDVGQAGIGLDLDRVEVEVDIQLGTYGGQLLGDGRDPLPATKFFLVVRVTVHAARGHIRIQLKGMPVDFELKFRALSHGSLEAAFADEAPGTHGVGDDVDTHSASLH